MKNKVFLSIIIPLYNKEKCIKQTINSIIDQGCENYEIIVVNDGSSDHSLEIVEKFHDDKIKIINQNNYGVSAARNRGIIEAQGEYCYFLDADDFMIEGSLKLLLELICEDYDMIIGGFHHYSTDKHIEDFKMEKRGILKNVFESHFKLRAFMQTGTITVKKKIAEKYYFNINYRRYEDLEAFFKWAIASRSIYFIDKKLINYNKTSSSLSIPSSNTYDYDYACCLDFNSSNFFLNCCKGRMLVDALYSYPTKTKEILVSAGFKGILFGLFARLWSFNYGMVKRIKNRKTIL